MNTENVKLTASISRNLKIIEKGEFDEEDIKLFLINIREYLREETFLREVADFVAHPERNKGICHKSINSRYAKMKMIIEGNQKLIDTKEFELHSKMPYSYFGDQILNIINYRQIPRDLFNLFVLDSLDDLSDRVLLEAYNMNKQEVRDLINASYQNKGGVFYLKSNVPQNKALFIDDILKFIRGTVLGDGAINQDHLRNDLNKAFNNIRNRFNLTRFDKNLISKNFKQIMVCLLALMHDGKFLMFDGTYSRAFLTIDMERLNTHKAPFYTLCLMIQTPVVNFPVITSNIKYNDFIDDAELRPQDWDLQEIPWVYTTRIAGKLKLINQTDLMEM